MLFGHFRSSVSRLTARERTMLAGLITAVFGCGALILIFFIVDGLGTLEQRNADMHKALRQVATGREAYLERKRQATNQRAKRPPAPALQSYLEQAAQEVGISIPEYNERPEAPKGKRHVERAVDFKLRDVDLEQLARFLHKVENGPYLAVTSQLSVRPRYRSAAQLDAQITVSTYDRAKAEPKKGDDKAKGDQP